MPHKVEISDKTYEKLREYCELNDLKMGSLADKFIYDGLMIEMYGDVPFTTYRKPPQEMIEIPVPEKLKEQVSIPKEIQEVIDNHFSEMLGDEKEPEQKQEEVLKQAGVPTKVVNRITKRRLK